MGTGGAGITGVTSTSGGCALVTGNGGATAALFSLAILFAWSSRRRR
jgi:hypothetical protein